MKFQDLSYDALVYIASFAVEEENDAALLALTCTNLQFAVTNGTAFPKPRFRIRHYNQQLLRMSFAMLKWYDKFQDDDKMWRQIFYRPIHNYNFTPCGAVLFSEICAAGDAEFVKWLFRMGCPWEGDFATPAVKSGSREIINFLMAKCNRSTDNELWLLRAAEMGDLSMVKWMHEVKGIPLNREIMIPAVRNGNAALVEWLHAGGYKWTNMETCVAYHRGHLDLTRWMIKQGCLYQASLMLWLSRDTASAHIITWLCRESEG